MITGRENGENGTKNHTSQKTCRGGYSGEKEMQSGNGCSRISILICDGSDGQAVRR